MVQQIINAIIPIAITAIVGVLSVVIKTLGDAAVAFIAEKKNEVVTKIGVNTYNQNLAFAKSVWVLVDEYFRVNSNVTKTIDSATTKFVEEMKKLCPQLTDDEIKQLQQIVAGQINQGRDAIVTPVAPLTIETPKDDPNKINLPEIPQANSTEVKPQ